MLHAALAQVPEALDFEGGRGSAAGAATMALPRVGQCVGHPDRGVIKDDDARAALEQAERDRIGGDHLAGSGATHLAERGGGLGGKALVKALGGNRGASSGSSLGKGLDGGGGFGEGAKDEGVDDGGSGAVALATDEASRACGGSGDGSHDRCPCPSEHNAGMKIWYRTPLRLVSRSEPTWCYEPERQIDLDAERHITLWYPVAPGKHAH